jgi:hypothetical protein
MTGKHPVDRRRFLSIAGGAAAATALSSSVARAAQIAPAVRTRTIKDVEHIVVLMQENRSLQFAGTGPDITAVPSGARLRLALTNRSSAACR